MKKILAVFMMCIFAFAFTVVRATDTSPALQKFSVEKTTVQAPAAFVSVNQQITEIPVFSFMVEGYYAKHFCPDHNSQFAAQASQAFINSNSGTESKAEIYHSPGWLIRSNSYSNPLAKENFSKSNLSTANVVRCDLKSTIKSYRSKTFSPVRIIPYSRDRS